METEATPSAAARPACAGAVTGAAVGCSFIPPAATRSPSAHGSAASGVGEREALAGLFTSVVAVRRLSDEELARRLVLLGRAKSHLVALEAEAVAELSRRRGEANAAELMRNELKQSRNDAKRAVQFAERLAALPETAQALSDGAITPQHARMIADAAEHTPIDEAELVEAAGREPVDVFGRTVRDHVNDRSSDDLEERRKRQRAQRKARITQQSDGMYNLFGRFDPVAGARIETALAAMAGRMWRAEDAKNRATPQQRFADALETLITRDGSGKSQSTTLLVIADYDTTAGRLQNPRLADGTQLAAEELVRLACEAAILPAVFDAKSQPLWLGREHRHASDGQRAVLAARDKGCVGCGRNHNRCQPHHIVRAADGGPTDIDNLCLLCIHCHHKDVHEYGGQIVRGPTENTNSSSPNHLHAPHPPPSRPSGNGASPSDGSVTGAVAVPLCPMAVSPGAVAVPLCPMAAPMWPPPGRWGPLRGHQDRFQGQGQQAPAHRSGECKGPPSEVWRHGRTPFAYGHLHVLRGGGVAGPHR